MSDHSPHQLYITTSKQASNKQQALRSLMDLTTPNYFHSPLFALPSYGEPVKIEANPRFSRRSSTDESNPFEDPLCKLNLRETSEFTKSFPPRRGGGGAKQQQRVEEDEETPCTPGRPVFSFSHSRKSKWDHAEKWLIATSSPAPAHALNPPPPPHSSSKPTLTKDKVSNFQVSLELDHNTHNSERSAFNGLSLPLLLKDKFTNDVVDPIPPNLKQGFIFKNPSMKDMDDEVIREVEHKDVGTEMTPLGSSTTSRCHTPFRSSSPARHNTPASRSGPLALLDHTSIDITQLHECHLAKLHLGSQYDSNWSSREEEDKEISKSLRHSETGNECTLQVPDPRAAAWEEEKKNKCRQRYQREEARIQAWVNLQNAKAEAQSMKLEVKIEKMRSNLEEKSMKRMAMVHRKAEEWRAAAGKEHNEQLQRANEKIINRQMSRLSSHRTTCGCLPCNN